MQQQLDAEFPDLDIQLIGVNSKGLDYGNADVTDGRDIPWLQDVDADGDGKSDVWTQWHVTPRDVVILDPTGQHVGAFNLTVNDLAEGENFQELKDLLVEVASSSVPTASVSGAIYFDVNDDGVRGSDESAIGGLEVQLQGTATGGESVSLVTSTDPDGSYAFQALQPGTYTVQVQQPAMTIDGHDVLGSAGGQIGDDSVTIQLDAGTQATGYDFTERGREAAAISLVDFLASTHRGGMLVAQTSAAKADWFALGGSWQEYKHVSVAPSDAPISPENALAVTTRNSHGHVFEAVWNARDAEHVQQMDEFAGAVLWRLSGEMSEIPRQAEPGSSSAEGEAAYNAPGDDNWLAAPELMPLPGVASAVPTDNSLARIASSKSMPRLSATDVDLLLAQDSE